MKKTFALTLATTLAAAWTASAQDAKLPPGQLEFFEKKIRPVLAEHCYQCHSAGAEKLKADLYLDSKDGLLKGGASGPAIVPGNPAKSLLVKTIRHDDPDMAMPPKKPKLADEVIADFERWIRMGAPDPRDGKTVAKGVDLEKAREHWAFKPVTAPPVPAVKAPKGFIQTPIDNFIAAKLRENGLEPAPKADKRTLIRRVTYDLIGLPPTPEEVDAFLADKSPDALAKVVDRLLESPRYGERWGRHWLDIARYADTSGDRQGGNRRNPLYPYAFTYRDYVINAFNEDKPLDRFILEQIAADKLPEAEKDKSVLAALGFLTVGKRFMNNQNEVIDDQIDVITKGLMGLTVSCARCHDHKFDPVLQKDYYALHGVFVSSIEPDEGPLLVNPETNPAYKEYLEEVVKVEQEVEEYHRREATRFAAGMLDNAAGYMMAVYDSLNGKDAKNNFRLFARNRNLDSELAEIWLETMKSLAKRPNDPVFGPWIRFAKLPEKEFAAKAPALVQEIAKARENEVHPLIAQAFAGKSPKSIKEVAALYDGVFSRLKKELDLGSYVGLRASRNRPYDAKKVEKELTDINLESLRQYCFGEDSRLMPSTQQMARTLGVQFRNAENAIRNQVVQLQASHPGSPARAMALQDAPRPRDSKIFIRGEARNLGPVAPRSFLTVLSDGEPKPFQDGSGRIEMAKEIASRDNPLTARVYVNRVWQWHFGQAIVRTPSDYGMRSDAPTHPELLDWLAAWFMDNGWSSKKLHRLICLSGAYQQDSRATVKGMEVDPTNQYLWRYNIQRLDFESIRDSFLAISTKLDTTMYGPSVQITDRGNNRGNNRYGADTSSARNNPYRRTVYAMIDRAALPEMFSTFDFANPDMSTGERLMTTVPQQALFMMNGPFVIEQVKAILDRPDVQAKTRAEDKVRYLFDLLYQREPTAKELQLAKSYLVQELAEETPAAPEPTTVKVRANNSTPRELNAWERYTQVLLLANEMIFVN
jgi:mono/diheme cytochrome c family protein